VSSYEAHLISVVVSSVPSQGQTSFSTPGANVHQLKALLVLIVRLLHACVESSHLGVGRWVLDDRSKHRLRSDNGVLEWLLGDLDDFLDPIQLLLFAYLIGIELYRLISSCIGPPIL
jgi:hypothetical protein